MHFYCGILNFSNKNVPKDVKRKVLAEKRAYETVKLLLEQDIDGNVFAKSVSNRALMVSNFVLERAMLE